MTLRDVLARAPAGFARFYPGQEWYWREAFLDTDVAPLTDLPRRVERGDFPGPRPYAAQLADLYLRFPDRGLWLRYLWCADTDAEGQRVYVGTNGRGLEIHRHLHLTPRWGVPVW